MLEEIFWFLLILVSSVYVGYFALVFIFSKRRLALYRATFYPTVSLIVPTYNESKVILNKLNNILDLVYPREKLQVVVVDSASEDHTCLIVQKFLENHKGTLEISLIPLNERLGKASALNDVWSSCTGEIAVITDADCLLDKNAIYALVQPFGDNRVGVVTGSHVIVNPGEFATKKIEQSYRSIFNVLRVGESYLDSTIIVNGQLCAFRKNQIENLSADSVCDDIELALRIRRKGYRIIYEPSAIFFEFTPKNFSDRLAQKTRRAQGIIQQLVRFSDMMFKRRYGLFAFLIFPFEFFFHVVSPLMFVALFLLFMLNVFQFSFLVLFSMLFLGFLGISGSLLLLRYLRKTGINPILVALTFFESQFYLLVGLFPLIIGRPSHKWKIIGDVRESSSKEQLNQALPAR